MFSLSHLGGFGAFTPAGGGIIRSIQPFEITIAASSTSNTATITSVDTSKSVIVFGGFTTSSSATALREFMPRAELTNATTITVSRDTSSSATVTVRGTVVEFASAAVTSVQQGTISVSASTASGTATISSVTTSRAAVFYLGSTSTTTATSPHSVHCRLDLTNSTTVTATRSTTSSAVITVGYCVVEFASGILASVQQRSVTFSTSATSSTDTISSVDTGNTMLLHNGSGGTNSVVGTFLYNLQLTAATTVTLTRSNANSASRTVNYTVLEFADGIISSIQRGTLAVDSATSADATITSVNTSKALCIYTGHTPDTTTTNERQASVKLLNATTVRAEKNTAGTSTATPGYEVVEFV